MTRLEKLRKDEALKQTQTESDKLKAQEIIRRDANVRTKPAQLTTRHYSIERNARHWHISQHLVGTYSLFKDKDNYRMYMRLVAKAARDTGIILVDFAIMPNHIHLMVQITCMEMMFSFMRKINIAFSMRMGAQEGGWFTDTPAYTPITTIGQFYDCMRYIFNNPRKWNLDKPDKAVWINEETGLYWMTASYQQETHKYEFSFNGPYVLRFLGKQWSELRTLLESPKKEFDICVSRIEKSMKPKERARFLKLDPSKDWSTDVSWVSFPDDEIEC